MAQITLVQRFATPDGKEFRTEEEALIHASKAEFSERAERFVSAYEWKRGRDTAARNTVLKFLGFEAVYGVDGPTPVAKAEAEETEEVVDEAA